MLITTIMHIPTTSSLFLVVLGALYLTPACAQRRKMQPVMVDGAVQESEADLGENAMIESILPSNITTTQPTAAPAAAAPPAPPPEPYTPINALLFSGSPGPKNCRGHVIMNLAVPKPGPATPQCYNTPGVVSCANFMANKDDGCEARLFAEPDCKMFVNLAVFIPEKRTMGGVYRSMEITCGVESVEPAPLNLGALQVQH
ncbi:uncharacterized protein BCR38DRAFT_439163 [Pseudomassariella vexata]|uniref:Uncharacterized protein n=1 Tax=Pseudomassariella vexata TaxID=1141098 RepID=A0A1Y2DTJ0_9PEZI|nr:uncharacterized protein BCR38DRAFT_439163 [Pseudomassariella vexata]ORY62588.1 hypothetical protein BCR38DRAFT_439163 [Pseudomassariella vexata]